MSHCASPGVPVAENNHLRYKRGGGDLPICNLDHVLLHSSRWSCEGLAESSDSSLIFLRSIILDLDSLSIDSAKEAKRVIIIAMKVKMESFMFMLIPK